MVLNDGETFTSLDGCAIVSVPDGWHESYIDFSNPDIKVITNFNDND